MLRFGLFLLAVVLSQSCRKVAPVENPLFTRLPGSETGLTFNNEITRFENDTFNSLSYDPIYNGAGVGIGDFDRDGRSDVFLGGNKVSSCLYLNRSDREKGIRFEDITEKAGVATDRWCTGVSVADVNQDGWPDVYVCVAGPLESGQDSSIRANLLFINEGTAKGGVPHFHERAAEYGLADTGFSTQAAFFDYDRDGDLDCYVLTNALERQGRNSIRPKRLDGSGPSTDRLYRNEGVRSEERGVRRKEKKAFLLTPRSSLLTPSFKNVSRQAGILAEGYGLGLCITDLNDDGWPDIYCANDFISNDLVWMNNQDGTFTDRAAALFNHTSYNSMGVDIADVNNDARPDVMVVDMLPENNERQKMMLIKTNWEYFHLARQQGYQDQYVRNVLQLNLGPVGRLGEDGAGGRPAGGMEASREKTGSRRTAPTAPAPQAARRLPVFSEVGQLAGVSRTDWSWAPLLADFDHDGYRDLVVSNGYRRDITNLDYAVYLNEAAARFPGAYGNPDFRRESLRKLAELPENGLHNYVFKNTSAAGGVRFEDKSIAWGLDEASYSNGAAYADFDGDGDLDLIFNNIDAEVSLYRNNRIAGNSPDSTQHWLRLKLEGKIPNRDAFGAKIQLISLPTNRSVVEIFSLEANPVRGYLSSVEAVWHFGLGKADRVRAEITWPNGHRQTLPELAANRLHLIRYQPDADQRPAPERPDPPYFSTLDGATLGLTYRHEETEYQDLMNTPLLPHSFSKNSPGIAVGDVNGDGRDDVFVGADPGRLRKLFLQKPDGTFSEKTLGSNESEDMGALFFDFDRDGDQDLYVVSGGSHREGNDPAYQDRLYLNDGLGNLTRSEGILPSITSSGGCVVAADFDRDGDFDLFRGGRVQPGSYPNPPRSYLLRNDGGHFTDITPDALKTPGLICAALWTDYDNDGWPDLMLAGEWMPLMFFKNEKGRFIHNSPLTIHNSKGWWNSLAAADVDRDGDLDYLAGNLGLNSKYQASPAQPLRLYAGDFDGNGRIDPVMTYFLEKQESLAPTREVITDQMTIAMRKRFTSYTAYARATVAEVLGDQRDEATVFTATELRSCLVENLGKGRFRLRHLPLPAQVSPVYGIQAGDFNADGLPDALLVGNSYAAEPYAGWYDAGRGSLLLGDGRGNFKPESFQEGGLNAGFDAKSLARVQTRSGPVFLVGNTNGPVQAFRPNRSPGQTLPLLPSDASAVIIHADGRLERVEFPYGSGYLSQSSRTLAVSPGAKDVRVFDIQGNPRRVWPAPLSRR